MEKIKTYMTVNKDFVCIEVNTEVYPLHAVYKAASSFIEKAYIFLDGDPTHKISIELKPKKRANLESLGREFYNTLISIMAEDPSERKDTAPLAPSQKPADPPLHSAPSDEEQMMIRELSP